MRACCFILVAITTAEPPPPPPGHSLKQLLHEIERDAAITRWMDDRGLDLPFPIPPELCWEREKTPEAR
jgi:hypothetical protein